MRPSRSNCTATSAGPATVGPRARTERAILQRRSSTEAGESSAATGPSLRRSRAPLPPIRNDGAREPRAHTVSVGDRGEIAARAGAQRLGGGLAGRLAVEIRGRAQDRDPIEVDEACLRPAFQ